MKKILSILAICFMFALSFPATAPAPPLCECPDDGNLCTIDDCDANNVCVHDPMVCEDDGDPCTDDYCKPSTGECVHPPNDSCDVTCDPKTQGYWHRQCLGIPSQEGGLDPGRNGRGPSKITEPNFREELIPCANSMIADLFPEYSNYDLSMPALTCQIGMYANPKNDHCEKAMKQLTALILNVCSDRLDDELCEVDVSCDSTSVGNLLTEIADLIDSGDCKQAADCADMVNTGDGLVD